MYFEGNVYSPLVGQGFSYISINLFGSFKWLELIYVLGKIGILSEDIYLVFMA